jgi:hypothetical protein
MSTEHSGLVMDERVEWLRFCTPCCERGMLVLLWVVGCSGNVKGLPIFLRWNNIGTKSVIHEILHTFLSFTHPK